MQDGKARRAFEIKEINEYNYERKLENLRLNPKKVADVWPSSHCMGPIIKVEQEDTSCSLSLRGQAQFTLEVLELRVCWQG